MKNVCVFALVFALFLQSAASADEDPKALVTTRETWEKVFSEALSQKTSAPRGIAATFLWLTSIQMSNKIKKAVAEKKMKIATAKNRADLPSPFTPEEVQEMQAVELRANLLEWYVLQIDDDKLIATQRLENVQFRRSLVKDYGPEVILQSWNALIQTAGLFKLPAAKLDLGN